MSSSPEQPVVPDAVGEIMVASSIYVAYQGLSQFMEAYGEHLRCGETGTEVLARAQSVWKIQREWPVENVIEQVANSSFIAGYSMAGESTGIASLYVGTESFAGYREIVRTQNPAASLQIQSTAFYLAGLRVGIGILDPPGFKEFLADTTTYTPVSSKRKIGTRSTIKRIPNPRYL